MFLAAALLLLGFPQTAPGTTNFDDSFVAAVDTAKSDSSLSAALPGAPAPKITIDKDASAVGESSSVSADLILPGSAIQPAAPPKAVMRRRYETPGQKGAWFGLAVVGHGAAGFDAYSTRRAMAGGYGAESNPLLRPFAHSSAIYAATQLSPAFMDYLGHKMMTNRRAWVRKMWWLPQSAGAGISITAGMHNMSLVK